MPFELRVPGKAMIAGEYAVLSGGPGIVCAVDRFLTCTASLAERDELLGMGRHWREGKAEDRNFRFVRAGMAAARAHLRERGLATPPVSLQFEDGLRAPDGKKLGLGGSAASTVAAVRAVLEASECPHDSEEVAALATEAHALAQGTRGSGFDVAASARRGLWLGRRDGVWRPLPPWSDEGAPMALVFLGRSASTPLLLEGVAAYARRAPERYGEFLERSREACEVLGAAIEAHDWQALRDSVEEADLVLARLGEASRVPIIVEPHRELAKRARAEGLSAKVSGAGGGDCSLVAGAPEQVARFVRGCLTRGLYTFPLRISG